MIWAFIISIAMAKDSWFCTEESSKVLGASVYACGIGQARDEGTARQASLQSANLEFQGLCNLSSNCRDKKVTIEPKRISCEKIHGGYKCTRLIVFIVSEEKEDAIDLQSKADAALFEAWDNDFRRLKH